MSDREQWPRHLERIGRLWKARRYTKVRKEAERLTRLVGAYDAALNELADHHRHELAALVHRINVHCHRLEVPPPFDVEKA